VASEQTGTGGKRPVILLVEDEALTIMDLGDVLEEGGYDTVQCASAERALSILQARPDPARMPEHADFIARPCTGEDILDRLRRLMHC
jgi:CheY-like chemotaxis protein